MTDYLKLVAEVRGGKRVGTDIYLHVSNLAGVPGELLALIEREAGGLVGADVVKLNRRAPRFSLLSYPGFFEQAFPELVSSQSFDLELGKSATRRYQPENPPILHRKETMLAADHPAVPGALAVTELAESAGLFSEPSKIGWKKVWAELLAGAGLRVRGASLVRR